MNKKQQDAAARNKELAGLTQEYPLVKNIQNRYSMKNLAATYTADSARVLFNKARELYRAGTIEGTKAMDLAQIVKAMNLIMRPLNAKRGITDMPPMTLAHLYMLLADLQTASKGKEGSFSDRPVVTETELPLSYVAIVLHLWRRNLGQHQIATHTGKELIRVRTFYRGLEELLRIQHPEDRPNKKLRRQLDAMPVSIKGLLQYIEENAGVIRVNDRVLYTIDKQQLHDKAKALLEREEAEMAEAQETIDIAHVKAAIKHSEIVADEHDESTAMDNPLAELGKPAPKDAGVMVEPEIEEAEIPASVFDGLEELGIQPEPSVPILPMTKTTTETAPLTAAKQDRLRSFLTGPGKKADRKAVTDDQ